MSKKRAKKIKLFLFDVDGVLTDGKLYFVVLPGTQAKSPKKESSQEDRSVLSSSAIEVKGFHAHDGAAISLAHLGGLKTGLITKRVSETVAVRARDLKLDHVRQGIQDKLSAFEEILKEARVQASEAAFVGDDVIDLPVMRNCGFAIAVANARQEVIDEAHFVTEHAGGDGAVRDAIEYVLKAQGKWKNAVSEYIRDRGQRKKAISN
jgi:3-deoxy-D-manno-octulosonate 8-phosphate phosphatase (KDO 8-P phosphatase)